MSTIAAFANSLGHEESTVSTRQESEGATVFEPKVIESFDLDQFSDWRKRYNPEDNTGHLFYFGGTVGYSQIEIIIDSAGFWTIRHEGRARNVSLEWADVSPQITSNHLTPNNFKSRSCKTHIHHSVAEGMCRLLI